MDSSEEEIDTRGNKGERGYVSNPRETYYKSSDEESDDDGYDSKGNYVGKKSSPKPSKKEEALYGEFLRHSPDRESGRRNNKKKKKVDYTQPIKFRPGEVIVNKATRATMVKPGVWKTPQPAAGEEEQRKDKFRKEMQEMQEMPTLFGKGGSKADIEKVVDDQRLKREEKKYERYGKGHKFLKKMGFTADQHVEIVHAVKRQDGLGLGANDPKAKRVGEDQNRGRSGFEYGKDKGVNKTKKPVVMQEPPKPSDKEFLSFLMKTSQETSKQKVKRERNTENEFTPENFMKNQRAMSELNIIDETGGHADRLFSRNRQDVETTQEDTPHSILDSGLKDPSKPLTARMKIVSKYNRQKELLKSKLQSCMNRKEHSNTQLITMDHELETIRAQVMYEEETKAQIVGFKTKLEGVLGVVESSQQVIEAFKKLYLEVKGGQGVCGTEILDMDRFNLAMVLCKILCHTLGKEAKNMDFLTQPLFLFDTVASYREFLLKILEDNVATLHGKEGEGLFGYSQMQEQELLNGKEIIQAYLMILLKDTIYHSLRQFISVRWDPIEQKTLIQFFQKWENIIPQKLLSHILGAYVLPKLKKAIESTNSQTTTNSSFFEWLSPWIKIIDQNSPRDSEFFRVSIRLKLVVLIKEWSPSNKPLTIEIQKWRSVYDDKNWKSLISPIIAKLAFQLKKLKIDPKNQKIEPLNWVLGWGSFMEERALVEIFRDNLLQRWVECLVKWGEMETADFGEIFEWYQGWKSMIPKRVTEDREIQSYFKAALIYINSKV